MRRRAVIALPAAGLAVDQDRRRRRARAARRTARRTVRPGRCRRSPRCRRSRRPARRAMMSLRSTAKGCGFGSDRSLHGRGAPAASSGAGSGGANGMDLGADHQAGKRAAPSPSAGRTRATTLPWRRIVAWWQMRPHLLQPVADVEHRAALAGEALQRHEQVVGLLRRQHRGRLVHDDELRLLQQAADDLDPLALADREVGDDGVRVERQAVFRRDVVDPRREPVEPHRAGERQRDVLGDGQRIEQREMLEHHADAEPPGGGGVGDDTGWPFQRISPAVGCSAP